MTVFPLPSTLTQPVEPRLITAPFAELIVSVLALVLFTIRSLIVRPTMSSVLVKFVIATAALSNTRASPFAGVWAGDQLPAVLQLDPLAPVQFRVAGARRVSSCSTTRGGAE